METAAVFHIPPACLAEEKAEDSNRWELHDRIFSEEHMYTFIKSAAAAKKLTQTSKVLQMAREFHEGQTRKGKDQVPYIYHPLMIACHALALGLDEDDLIAAILLHDVCEDCGATLEDIPVNDDVKKAIELVTFCVQEGETKEQAKRRYYEAISENRLATIIKVLDRCNNISTMAVAFSKKKMAAYIDETEEYVLPLLNCIKTKYPECYNAAFLLKYQMLSILESLKRTII